MIGTRLANGRLCASDLVLAGGMAISAVLVAVVGGWLGLVVGVLQVVAGLGVLARPGRPGVLAVVALLLIPAPLGAVRQWMSRLPLACHCLRGPKPPPGIASLTGLLVLIDLALGGLAVWSARAAPETGETNRTNGP